MTRASLALWSALVLLGPAVCAGAQTPARTLTIQEYVAWLDRTAAAVDEGRIVPAESLPPLWLIETPAGPIEVSNAWLVRDLRALQTTPDPDRRARARDRLRILGAEARAFEDPPGESAGTRARLNEILQRREFRNLHGPTWRDRLRQRLLQLIVNLLNLLFGTSVVPTISHALVYVLIGVAALVVGVWTFRSVRRASRIETIVPDRVPISAKAWAVWLSEAQSASARGEWREAIHLSYWCAVSFLEARGAWRPDRARTPREYLRLLGGSSAHRNAVPELAALTGRFERVWYGTDAADREAYAEALVNLERLGCRPA